MEKDVFLPKFGAKTTIPFLLLQNHSYNICRGKKKDYQSLLTLYEASSPLLLSFCTHEDEKIFKTKFVILLHFSQDIGHTT